MGGETCKDRDGLKAASVALLPDGDTHRARGALDDALRRLDADGVEILHLQLGDLAKLSLTDLANLRLVWRAGALLDACSLLQEVCGGRRLDDEGKRAVFVDGDDGRHDAAHHSGRALVVLFAEAHDV